MNSSSQSTQKNVAGQTESHDNKANKRYQELREIALRLSQLPESKKGLFRQALKAKGINPWKLPITPANTESQSALALSFAQQRLWLLDQIEGAGGHAVISNALKLDGRLNLEFVNQAFTQIIQRHESLRTCFKASLEPNSKEQVTQFIQTVTSFSAEVHDLSSLNQREQEQAIQALLAVSKNTPFDLANDLMLRANVIVLSEQSHILQFVTHHIASDGWSLAILIKEFGELYNANINNRSSALAKLPIQYSDYAHWQRDWLQGEELENQLSYWRKQLQNLPTTHELPLDKPRPSTQSFAGAKLYSQLSPQTSQRLRDYCQSAQATLFMGLHAAFSVLLSRYSGVEDIVVGSPVANREQQEVSSLIGFFVNLLVLRSDVSGNPNFDTMLQRSKACLLDAYAHQQVPFEEIVEDLKPVRSLNHSPLFQVLLVLQNNDNGNQVKLDGISAQALEQDTDVAHYDLSLYVFEREDYLELSWQYNTDIFDRSTIKQMASHFDCLLGSLLDKPSTPINAVTLMNKGDVKQITQDWNDSSAFFESNAIEQLISKNSALYQDQIAVQFEEQSLSYAELEVKSNQLAHALQASGIVVDSANQLVGIVQHRSTSMLISVLAVMKAGAAYVPIDPNYPKDRVHYMLDHSGLELVLTDNTVLKSDLFTTFEKPKFDVLNVDDPDVTAGCSSEQPKHSATEHDLAYVIYTSGSTGKPKGVQITRSNLANFILGMKQKIELSQTDTLLAVTSLSFDIAALELYLPLVCGAQVIIGDELLSMDGERLKACIENNVTVMQATPVTWKLLLGSGWQHDQKESDFIALCGGEAFPLELAQALLKQQISIWNLYGPTETTVWSAAFNLNDNKDLINASVPIGKPIANTQLYVLDQHLNPVPIGVSGELYIGGAGVAMGYLHSPELSAERFIESDDFGRIYQTGDLARYRQDGTLECLGRIDSQVKVRGYRIELGEVEHCLLQHTNVIDVAVNPVSMMGEPVLVAYVVLDKQYSNEDRSKVFTKIKNIAAEKLPSYMVPSMLVSLEALPLTPNGKIDRKALPTPDDNQQHVYAAPETELEKTLVKIWQEVLQTKQNDTKIGINDNFFSLGGHSMLVVRVIALLQAQGINANVKQVFAKPVLRDLAVSLDQSQKNNDSSQIFRAAERKIPEDCKQVKPEHLPLVNLTQTDIDTIAKVVPGGMSNILDIYPLGPLQQGIHFHHLMSQKSDPYVFPNLLKVADTERLEALLSGLQFMIDRHDVLRTCIVTDDINQTVQVVCRNAELPVQWQHFEEDQNVFDEMQRLCEPDKQWMDIRKAPLLSVLIAKEANSEQHYVLLQYHHLISDHQGLEIIKRELGAFLNQQTDLLPTVTPYREFVAHAQYQAETHDAKAFFSNMLSDIDQPTLPFGLTDTQSDGQQIIDYREAVPNAVAEKLRHIAQKEQVNPASIFHAAWALVVAACSNQQSVVFGSVLSGRLQGTAGAENMMGVFINTLPFRVDVDNRDVRDYVRSVNHSLTELLSFEQTPLVTAQSCSSVAPEQPLFSALLNYRHSNYANRHKANDHLPNGENVIKNEGLNGVEFAHIEVRNNYPLTLSVDDYGMHGFNLAGLFHQSIDAARLMGYMQNAISVIVDALANNDRQAIVNQLSVLCESERTAIIRNNLTKETQSNDLGQLSSTSIIQLFENVVESNPRSPALTFGQEHLSYGELNKQVNQLAHFLVSKNISRDKSVAIYLQRGPEFIVALLATLKAGGCYLPLDTQWPSERVAQILVDAKPELILSKDEWQSALSDVKKNEEQQNDSRRGVDSSTSIYYLDSINNEACSNPQSNLELEINPHDSAYVIYTSGSSGKPKGVVVEHEQLNQYCHGINQRLKIAGMSFAHLSTIAADLGNTSLFGALCFGGCLNLIDVESATSPDLLASTLAAQPVDAMKIVPTHLQGLMSAENPADLLPKKLLILGGEACSLNLVEQIWKLSPKLRIVNHYGPSETTIGVLTHELSQEEVIKNTRTGSIAIGKPLPNVQVYILNNNQQLCPEGVVGELYIGGSQVSRGYLNQVELSQDSFIENPFTHLVKHKRLYKTGDRVRRLENGNIDFLGRIDEQQVNVRGYRVELSEIKNVLLAQDSIDNAVVLLEQTQTNPRLIAWIVRDLKNHSDSDSESYKTAVTSRLQQLLPSYMVPQDIVLLETIPVTANGKSDKTALMQIAERQLNNKEKVSDKPSSDIEKRLAVIWSEILKTDKIGINSDFFELGGDSILSLQVISKAKKAGLKITPKLIFAKPTIAELAKHAQIIESNDTKSNRMTPVGDVLLTPIQYWFFEKSVQNKHHWNQSMVLDINASCDTSALQKASLALVKHHDALRMRFEQSEQGWQQRYAKVDDISVYQKIGIGDLNLSESDDSKSINIAIESHVKELQASLDIGNGPLFRVAHFELSGLTNEPDRLILIVHHLVVDGVSWRILLNDFHTLYQQSIAGKPLQLDSKTSTFQEWAKHLTQYAHSQKLSDEVAYWEQVANIASDSKQNILNQNLLTQSFEANQVLTQSSISTNLSLELTHALLQDTPAVYGTQINDLLLTALTKLLCTENNSTVIELEGHGREQYDDKYLDVSQTVGWFTTRFPFQLVCENDDFEQLIKKTTKQLRSIPNKGLGYGLIRYLNPNEKIRNEFSNHSLSLLSFNYLGQFDVSLGSDSNNLWTLSNKKYGHNKSPDSQRSNAIDLVGAIVDGSLQMTWQYSTALYSEEFISMLAEQYNVILSDIIKHCIDKGPGSNELDVDYGTLSKQQLQIIQKGEKDTQKTPLFCLHPRGGHTLEYRNLVKSIDNEIPIYGIQSQLLSDPSYNEFDITTVAIQYADLIQSVQSTGPYQLLGWSLGGVLAMEITQEFEARGQEVSFLGLIDSMLINPNKTKIQRQKAEQGISVVENLFEAFGYQAKLRYNSVDKRARSQFERTLNQISTESSELKAADFACNWIIKEGLVDAEVIDIEYLRLRYLTTMHSRRLIKSYKSNLTAKHVNATTYVWWAENSLMNNEPPTSWQQHCSNIVQQQQYPGGHFDIMQNKELANELAQLINANSLSEK